MHKVTSNDTSMDASEVASKRRARAVRFIVCFIFAFAFMMIISAACSKTGDNDNENGADPDSSSAGEETADSQGMDGGGDDEPDDAFATAPSIEYPQEVQAQLETFHDIAAQLSLDDIASAAALLMAYRDLALEGPVNDALFFSYEEYMQFVCEGLNSVYEEEPPDDATVNDALENGFLFISDDDYSAYFILRPDFLKDTFTETVSARVQAYLNLTSKHYNFHNGYDFIEKETLMVTLDQLAEMIVDWENYINVYPDVTNRSDIEMNLDYYLKIYIGSIQIENSGLYMLAGTDENGEALYKLMDEPRQSYMKFVENYPDSAACPLISELYQVYSDNNFLYSVNVEDFFRKYGLAYDI